MMSQRDAFLSIVCLYRGLGRPPINGNSFSFTGILTADQLGLLDRAWSTARAEIAGIRVETPQGGLSTELNDTLTVATIQSQEVTVTAGVPNGQYQFKESLNEYLSSANRLNTGEDIQDLYLAEEDHLFGEAVTNQRVARAANLSQMILKLIKISDHSDLLRISSTWKIVFIVPSEDGDKHKPIAFEPKITPALIDESFPDLTLLSSLTENVDDAHNEEKASIFRVSMFEIFQAAPKGKDSFFYLVNHWQELTRTYRKNYELYIRKFSFLRQKKLLSSEYIGLSEKISGSLSSITTQLFGLPISIAVVFTVFKTKSIAESLLLVVGALLASLILVQIIREQQRLRRALGRSIDHVFEASSREVEAGDELHSLIAKYKRLLKEQASYVGRCLFSFRVLAWSPAVTAVGILVIKFPPNLWFSFLCISVAGAITWVATCVLLRMYGDESANASAGE